MVVSIYSICNTHILYKFKFITWTTLKNIWWTTAYLSLVFWIGCDQIFARCHSKTCHVQLPMTKKFNIHMRTGHFQSLPLGLVNMVMEKWKLKAFFNVNCKSEGMTGLLLMRTVSPIAHPVKTMVSTTLALTSSLWNWCLYKVEALPNIAVALIRLPLSSHDCEERH